MNKQINVRKLIHAAICLLTVAAVFVPTLFLTAVDVQAKKVKKIVIIDGQQFVEWVEVADDDDDDHVGPPKPADYGDVSGARSSDPLGAQFSYNFNYPFSTMHARYMQNGKDVANCSIGVQAQGGLGGLAFSKGREAGWKEACPFNITINGSADYTLKKGTLIINIPEEYRKAGRVFALLGIDKDGNVVKFTDTDTGLFTFTTEIDIEGYAFDLIYFDPEG